MPLITLGTVIVTGTALTGGIGIVKGIEGVKKYNEADNIIEETEQMLKKATSEAETALDNTQSASDELVELKLNILNGSLKDFIDAFNNIHDIELESSSFTDDFAKFRIEDKDTVKFEEISDFTTETLKSSTLGVGAGALSTFAATKGIAMLGGGSLLLGKAALTGIFAGPAIMTTGIIMNAKAEKNLENAKINKATIEVAAEKLKSVKTVYDGLAVHTYEFTKLLKSLDYTFVGLIQQLENIIATKGSNYDAYDKLSQNKVAMSLNMAIVIKRALETPMFDNDMNLTSEFKQVCEDVVENSF